MRVLRLSHTTLALAVLLASMVSACTVFSYVSEEGVWFGNSEDYDLLTAHIWFLEPRGGSHGVLCLGFDQGSLQGGMNTAGLCYDATGSTGMILNWHRELPEAPANWISCVLRDCATVDEVEAWMRRYDYSMKGMAQFLWVDRNGDSLIVTSRTDGEIAYLRQSGGFRVITNFNVTEPSVGTYPCWRYDTAEASLRALAEGSASPSIAYFRTILNGVHFPGYTAYSNIFDLSTLTAHVYRSGNFRDVRVIHLPTVLEAGAPGLMTLEDFFGASQD